MTAGALAGGVVALVVTLACWYLRRSFLVATVSGVSMVPTYSEGDRLLVRRTRPGRARRDDVVVLTRAAPVGAAVAELMVKRVAALPGDDVPAGMPVPDAVVPPGRLLVLGDNPAGSYDSRRAGYFALSAVVGVVSRPMRRSATRMNRRGSSAS